MTRSYQRWTPQLDDEFAALVEQGLSNVEIARLLERTAGSIGNHKVKLGLVQRSPTCPRCHGPIKHLRTGHPRRYCSDDCAREAHRAERREIAAAQAEARQGRTCAGPGCTNPLPTNNVQRRFCSRLCSARIREQTYRRPTEGST